MKINEIFFYKDNPAILYDFIRLDKKSKKYKLFDKKRNENEKNNNKLIENETEE